jgi:cytoskeletal protein CcmA (bactofilin family)
VCLTLAGCALFVVADPAVAAQSPPSTQEVARSQNEGKNVYLAGFAVRPERSVVGDFFAAGCPVSVDRPVGEDAVVAGCDVYVKGPVGDDLRAAGGQVTVDGKVGGEAIVAGGKVTLTSGSEIGGRASLGGGEVSVSGTVGKDLKIYARRVSIEGEVEGDTRVIARELELLPGAKIKGALTYASREELKMDPKAQVLGKITREPTPSGLRREGRAGRPWALHALWLVGLIAAGALFVLVFPGFAQATQANVGSAPWKSLGLGTAVLFAGPPIMVVLLITVIGIPIALALLAAYAIMLLTGYLTIGNFIGIRVAYLVRRSAEISIGWRVGAVAVALVLLAFIRMIPFAGALLTLVALVAGTGALVLQLFRRYSEAV